MYTRFSKTGILIVYAFFFSDCALYFATKVPPQNLKFGIEQKKTDPDRKSILFLGDSITHGAVSSNYVDFVRKDPKLSSYLVLNEGINSRLTYQLLPLLEDVVELQPEMIFILIGTNDLISTLGEEQFNQYKKLWKMTERPNRDTYQKNLGQILDTLQKRTKAKIVLISVPPLGEDPNSNPYQVSKDYASIDHKIAEERKISIIPLFEILEKGLSASGRSPRASYTGNYGIMYWAIFQYYTFFRTWDGIADSNGFEFLTDSIHLNDKGGKILSDLIIKEIASKELKTKE